MSYQHYAFVLNPKYSTLPATKKKIIPGESRTHIRTLKMLVCFLKNLFAVSWAQVLLRYLPRMTEFFNNGSAFKVTYTQVYICRNENFACLKNWVITVSRICRTMIWNHGNCLDRTSGGLVLNLNSQATFLLRLPRQTCHYILDSFELLLGNILASSLPDWLN